MPKNESFVETPEGAGNVCQVDLLKETVKVRLDSAPETPKCFHNCELRVIRNGKGKRPEDYVEPPAQELAKLRKVTPVEEPRTLTGSVNAALAGLSAALEEENAPAQESRRSRSRRRKSGGEQQPQAQSKKEEAKPAPQKAQSRPPKGEGKSRPESRPKAQEKPAYEKTAAEGGQANAAGEKKRPRRRYHRRPRGDKPQNPNPQ